MITAPLKDCIDPALPVPSRNVTDTEFLCRFFEDFRKDTAKCSIELARFFEQFAQDFLVSRSTRAAKTPRLNVLRIFGLEFKELRHSDALAWFLDPQAEHEQGTLFANALLQLVNLDPLDSENYCVRRERHERTDVALYAPTRFAVFIENKVLHFEREKQVSDMVDSLIKLSISLSVAPERRFAIFLTDSGAQPVTGPTEDSEDFLVKHLVSLRRVEVFEAFRTALASKAVHSPLLINFIDSYLNSIRRIRTLIA